MSDEKPLDPEQARIIAKVRRLMTIVGIATFVALAAVLGLIGYRVFSLGDSAPEVASKALADVTAAVPAGARLIATDIGEDRIVLTLDIAGVTELRIFDLETLQPLGRLRLEPKP